MNEKQASKPAVFAGKQIRKILHKGEWWFVIVDVVAALTDSADPSDYLKKMRRRDTDLSELFKGGGQFVPSLPWRSPPPEALRKSSAGFRLIQSIPSPKAEPFKHWLARVGKERIDEIENPELVMGRMQEPD